MASRLADTLAAQGATDALNMDTVLQVGGVSQLLLDRVLAWAPLTQEGDPFCWLRHEPIG